MEDGGGRGGGDGSLRSGSRQCHIESLQDLHLVCCQAVYQCQMYPLSKRNCYEKAVIQCEWRNRNFMFSKNKLTLTCPAQESNPYRSIQILPIELTGHYDYGWTMYGSSDRDDIFDCRSWASYIHNINEGSRTCIRQHVWFAVQPRHATRSIHAFGKSV